MAYKLFNHFLCFFIPPPHIEILSLLGIAKKQEIQNLLDPQCWKRGSSPCPTTLILPMSDSRLIGPFSTCFNIIGYNTENHPMAVFGKPHQRYQQPSCIVEIWMSFQAYANISTVSSPGNEKWPWFNLPLRKKKKKGPTTRASQTTVLFIIPETS